MPTNRREFMLGTTAAAAAALTAKAQSGAASAAQTKKPNIILYLADQFRWDFVGANRLNNSTNTPNLDAMAERGTLVYPCGHQPAGMFPFAFGHADRPLCNRDRCLA